MRAIVDWTVNLISEVENDVPNIIYRISSWYMNFNSSKLSAREITNLQSKYDADPWILENFEKKDLLSYTSAKFRNKLKISEEILDCDFDANKLLSDLEALE